jgi:outer membrane autotransporter protein
VLKKAVLAGSSAFGLMFAITAAHATDYTITNSGDVINDGSGTGLALTGADNIYVYNDGSTGGAVTMQAGDTLDMAVGKRASTFTITGAGITDTGGTIKTYITGAGNTDTATAASTSTIAHIAAGGAVSLTNTVVVPNGNFLAVTQGARYALATGVGTATVTGVTTTSSSPLITWSVVRSDDATYGIAGGGTDTDAYLVATTVNSVSSQVTSTNAKAVGSALTSAASSTTDSATLTLLSAVSNLTSSSDLEKAMKQLSPNTSLQAASQAGSVTATTANINTINSRAYNVRLAQSGKSGFASGNSLRGLGLWIQGYGTSGSQDARQGVDGYDVLTGGVAMGGDVQVAKSWRVGGAFAYGHSKVDSTGDSKGTTSGIDSYQAAAYANYTAKRWYLDTTLVYGRHQYENTRAINFTGFSDTAKASYGGNQYTAQVAGGVPLVWKNVLFTPNLSLTYSMLQQDGYTESGTSGGNLTVDSQNNNSFKTGLGMKASKSFSNGKNRVVPEVRATWYHEYASTAPDSTARFVAGGTSFTTTGAKPASDSFVAGLGLSLVRANRVTISANYDAELRDSYVGHNGMLQLRYNF